MYAVQLALFMLTSEVEVSENGVLITLYFVGWNGYVEVLEAILL